MNDLLNILAAKKLLDGNSERKIKFILKRTSDGVFEGKPEYIEFQGLGELINFLDKCNHEILLGRDGNNNLYLEIRDGYRGRL